MGEPGFPDDSADNVEFDNSAAIFEVDLRGGDRDVGNMRFSNVNYRLVSNTGGMGTLRINGNLSQINLGKVTFKDTIRVFQSAPGTWSASSNAIIFDAQLLGTADISSTAGVIFNAANP